METASSGAAPSYLIIANPASGRGRGAARAEQLRHLLGAAGPAEVAHTDRRGAATQLAAAAVGQVDRVIAVGGDGTLNEVLTGLLSVGVPAARVPALGFLPSGTANVAAPAFGFETNPLALARQLVGARERPTDVGFASFGESERPFLLWCGAGYDAVIIDALNRERTGRMGFLGFALHAPRVWRAVSRYGAPGIDVRPVEAAEHAGPEVQTAVLANVGRVAFGGVITHAADPFDGRMDLVTLRSASRVRLVRAAARLFTSSLDRARDAHHVTVDRVRLSSTGEVPFHLDGEPVGILPTEIRIAPAAIRLLLP
jgi:diacylglycerol kinase (ATP)